MPVATPRRILAVLVEGGRQDQVLAGGQVLGRDDLLLEHADEAVDVVQPVVLDVQRVPAEPGAVGEQHALRAGRGDVHQRADGVGAVADVHRLGLGDLGDVGVVDVAVARAGELRPGRVRRSPAGTGRRAGTRRCAPASAYHRLTISRSLSGCSAGEVVQLGAVDVGVVELPGVVVEVAPAADRRVGGDRLPAVVPDRRGSRASSRTASCGPRARRVVEAGAHAHAVERALGVALDRLRRRRRPAGPGSWARGRWRGGTGGGSRRRGLSPRARR